MRDLNPRGFVALAADQIGPDNRQWIEVMPTAEKAKNGRWLFTITSADLETFAAFLRANPDRIPIDYDHEGADGGSTVAAGWFTGNADVVERDGVQVLRAEVEWTPQGAQDIRDKRFRFISPEWTMANRDKKSGLLTKAKEIVAATVTNRPFFRELAPIARDLLDSDDLAAAEDDLGADVVALALVGMGGTDAERDAAERILAAVWTTAYVNNLPDSAFLYVEPGGSKDSGGKTTPRSLRHFPVKDANGSVDMPHLRNALARIPQSSLPADVKERCARTAQNMLKRMGGGPSARLERNDMDTTVLAKSLGLAEDADEAEIAEAIKAKDDKIAELSGKVDELATSASETDKLRADLDTIKAEREHDRKVAAFEQAVRDRQFMPVQRDVVLGTADTPGWSLEQINAWVEKTPKGTFSEAGSDGGGKPAASETKPELEDVVDTSGRVVAKKVDPDWLDARAREILTEQNKTMSDPGAYVSALDQAQREALTT